MAGIRGIEPRSSDRQSDIITSIRYTQIFSLIFYYLYIIIYFFKKIKYVISHQLAAAYWLASASRATNLIKGHYSTKKGMIPLELEVGFEPTWACAARLQGESYQPLRDSSICIFGRRLVDLGHLPHSLSLLLQVALLFSYPCAEMKGGE